MSRVVLSAFALVMGLGVAAADYVNESRRLGLPIGAVSGADYAGMVRQRLGLGGDVQPGAGSATQALADGTAAGIPALDGLTYLSAPLDGATGTHATPAPAPRAGLAGLVARFLPAAADVSVPDYGAPIDLAPFTAVTRVTERAGAPSGAVAFTRVGTGHPAGGVCVSSGTFKRCRVGD